MSAAASSLGSTSSEISTNYLNLLVTQLKYQDPTAPMDTNQMAGQLSQLAQLQQLEMVSSNFSQVLELTRMSQGVGLIGRTIAFTPSGEDTPVAGPVEAVDMTGDVPRLIVGTYSVGLDEIQAIY